jgi:flagellar hook-length control protein FliK
LGAKQPICAQGQSNEQGEAGSNVLASTQALVSQKSPSERSQPASLLSGKETVGNTLRTSTWNDSESGTPKGTPKGTTKFDEPGPSVSSTAAVGNTTDTAIQNDVKSQIPKAVDNRGEANNLPLASYLTPNSIGAQSDVFKQFGLLTGSSLPSKESVSKTLPAVALNDAKSGIPKAADSRSEMNNLFLAAHLAPNAVEPQNTDALKQFGLSKNKEDERIEPASNTVANSGSISMTAPASTQGLEAPRVVTISTPAQAPEFKEALALQVSLLAKDGVHEATLQLNPENMGPISVQISTDGTQARVEFAVESSATRDIIEAGMPDLASALRDAGLTFSGGSVSQNNSQRGDSPPPQPGRSQSSPNEGVEATPLPQRTLQVRLGGLDLYA